MGTTAEKTFLKDFLIKFIPLKGVKTSISKLKVLYFTLKIHLHGAGHWRKYAHENMKIQSGTCMRGKNTVYLRFYFGV